MLLQKCNTGDGVCSAECKEALGNWKSDFGCCSLELFAKAMLISGDVGALVSPEMSFVDKMMISSDPKLQYLEFSKVFMSWAAPCSLGDQLKPCRCTRPQSVGLKLPLPPEVRAMAVDPAQAHMWKTALRQDLARSIQEDIESIAVRSWSLSRTGSMLEALVDVATPGCEQTSQMAGVLRERIQASTILLAEWGEVVAAAMPATKVHVTQVISVVEGTLALTGKTLLDVEKSGRPQFELGTRQSIADAADVARAQVSIKALRAGSILVDYIINASDYAHAKVVGDKLKAQAANLTSTLASSLKTQVGATIVVDPVKSDARPEQIVQVSSSLDFMTKAIEPLEVKSGFMRAGPWPVVVAVAVVQVLRYRPLP